MVILIQLYVFHQALFILSFIFRDDDVNIDAKVKKGGLIL